MIGTFIVSQGFKDDESTAVKYMLPEFNATTNAVGDIVISFACFKETADKGKLGDIPTMI